MYKIHSNYTTLKVFLHLNAPERIFINNLLDNFNESQYMENLKHNCNISFIVKISENSSNFSSICRMQKYRELWSEQWTQLALLFSDVYEKEITLFKLPLKVNVFNAIKGEYFFLQSQIVRKEMGKNLFSNDFVFNELEFLKKGVNYNSVHAIQRYNHYLYQQNNFIEIIENCKKLIETHGSYAYMMLAEAYFRYGSSSEVKKEHRREIVNAAIIACENAKLHMEASSYSIINASFGEGLKTSNSLNISEPEEIIRFFQNWLAENTDNLAYEDEKNNSLSISPLLF